MGGVQEYNFKQATQGIWTTLQFYSYLKTERGVYCDKEILFNLFFSSILPLITYPPFLEVCFVKSYSQDFPGSPVVKNPPANAGDMGLIPGLGRLHMRWSN